MVSVVVGVVVGVVVNVDVGVVDDDVVGRLCEQSVKFSCGSFVE